LAATFRHDNLEATAGARQLSAATDARHCVSEQLRQYVAGELYRTRDTVAAGKTSTQGGRAYRTTGMP